MADEAWRCTYSGKGIDLCNPEPGMIDFKDIAHALANVCRWVGHVDRFYSVAEHCVRVAAVLRDDKRLALYGLLHDAAEAYLSDVPGPIKRLLPKYIETEDRLLRVILGRVGLSWPIPPQIEVVDKRLLATEWRDLMPGARSEVALGVRATALSGEIRPWRPEAARTIFLAWLHKLTAALDVEIL